jgi:S1-C subfamily serine protease
MGKTIIVFEDGKVVDTIEEEKWEGVKIENGKLIADIPPAPDVGSVAVETVPEPLPEPVPAPAAATEIVVEPVAELKSATLRVEPADILAEPAEGVVAPPPAAVFEAAAASADAERIGQIGPIGPAEQTERVEEPRATEFEPQFRPDGPRPAPAPGALGGAEHRFGSPAAADRQYPWRGETAYENAGSGNDARGGVDAKKVIAVILGLVLAAGAGFGGGVAAVNTGNFFYPATAQQITITPTDQVSTTEAVAAKVIPSVVGITSVGTREVEVFPFGTYNNREGGVGTGIIVDESGYILTNSHVVMDGDVDTITVLLPDGRDVQGDVLWNERVLDLAIVKVDASNLIAAELGDSDEINIGSYVAAIGNPMGLDFRSSVSQGVVSGLDRAIVASSGTAGETPVQMEGLIQVDAAINNGNSGGPLVNSLGRVIGINTARNQYGEGMGFAIPINTAKPIVDSVKATGEFHRVYLGVTPVDVTEFLQAYPQTDLGVESGAYIYRISPGSPAEAAGIQEKDIIVEVDGKKINTSSELIKHLLGYRAGDAVKVKIVRDKRQLTFDVTLTDSLE